MVENESLFPELDSSGIFSSSATRDLNMLIPSGEPPPVNIQTTIAGNYQTGPLPATKVDKSSFAQGIVDSFNDAQNWAYDPNAFAKVIDYGSGKKGMNFERYYNHPKFKELGYSPFRDNESLYNEKSSWWDDFVRMGGSFGNLFSTGFKSIYDFGSENSADEFEKAMAVGMTNKGGVGGFVTNLALNSAFTLGIAAEMVAENFAIAGITYATGGLAAPLALKNISQGGMVSKRINEAQDILSSTKAFVQNLSKNPSAARGVYDSMQGVSSGEKVWNFVNPLSRSQEYLTNLYRGANGFREMNNFVKTRKAFGAFYRDLREMNLVYSEAMLEGNMARNQNNEKAIDDFYKKNGRMPTDKESQDIFQKSMSVGFATSVANMPVIYFTNKLVFDDLFRGFKTPSLVGQEIINGSERHLRKAKNWKLGDDAYQVLQKTAKEKVSDFLFRSSYLPWTKKYMLGNLGEGIQELSQEVTSDAANMYYERKYADPATAAMYSPMTAVGSAMANQFSIKGLEVFASGFLMGSVVQGVSSAVFSPMVAPGLYNKYLKSAEFQKLKESKQKTEDMLVGTVNELINTELGNFNSNIDSALDIKDSSKIMEQAQLDNNKKAYGDAKDQKRAEFYYMLASSKKMDLIYDQVDGLEALADNDLADAMNATVNEIPEIRTRLREFKDRASTFQSVYNGVKERFSNPYNPSAFDPNTDRDAFANELNNMQGWDNAVKDLIMATTLYSRNLERMDSVFQEFSNNKAIRNAKASDFSILLDQKALDYEIEVLQNEVSVMSEGTPEQKKEARKKDKKLQSLLEYRAGMTAYMSNMVKARKIMAQKQAMSDQIAVGNIFRDKETGGLVEVLDISEDGETIGILTEDNETFDASRDLLQPVYEDSFTEEAIRQDNEKLFEIFKNYIGVMTDVTDSSSYDNQAMENSFVAMRDYFAMKNETNQLFNAVNMLTNPEQFLAYSNRLSQMQKVKNQNFGNIIRSSYSKLSKVYLNNNLLNNLYDMKISIDPEDAKKVLDEANYEGVTFYDAFNAEVITDKDDRFKKLQQELANYKSALNALKPESKKTAKEAKEGKAPEQKQETEETYKKETEDALREYIRAENAERKKNGERTISEDINDPQTKDFINEDSGAQDIIKRFEEKRKSKKEEGAKPKRKKVDWTPKKVPAGLEELAPLYKEVWVTSENERGYVNEKGDFATRVTYLKQDWDDEQTGSPAGKERGTVMDDVMRAVIEGKVKLEVDEKGKVTDESIGKVVELLDKRTREDGFIVEFEPKAIEQFANGVYKVMELSKKLGLKLYADVPTIVNKLGDDLYGGSIDILAKDKDGNYFIIDLKTNDPKYDRRKDSGKKRYRNADTIQLNAYAELFYKSTGKKIKGVYILNMSVEHGGPYSNEKLYKKVTNIRLELDSTKKENDMGFLFIPIEMKDIYELDRTIGKKRLKEETGGFTPEVSAAKYDLVKKFGMDQAEVDKMDSNQILVAYENASKDMKAKMRKRNDEFVGKIVYVTPGGGKSTLAVEDMNIIDMDELLFAEMQRRQPQFAMKAGQTMQDYIYEYTMTFGDKDDVNRTVLKLARKYANAGRTVLTGTLAMIPFVDAAIVVDNNNPRVIERFGSPSKAGTYAKREKEAVDKFYETNENVYDITYDEDTRQYRNLEDDLYIQEEGPAASVSDNNFSTKSIEKRKEQIEIEGYKFYKVDNTYDIEDKDEGIVAERINSLEEAVITAEKLYTLKNISQDEDGDWGSGLEYGFGGKTKQEVIDQINAKYNAELAALGAAPVSKKKTSKKKTQEDVTGDPKEEWYNRVGKLATLEDFKLFESEVDAAMANQKSLKAYLSKNALTYDEIEMVMESLRNKFGMGGAQVDTEPVVDKDVKDEKRKASSMAGDMSTEMDVLSEMSDTKISEEQAAEEFFDSICGKKSKK